MRILDPRWTGATFLMYFGGLVALGSSIALLGVIGDDHGEGALAGFSVLFFGALIAIALALRQRERPVAAGVFAFVGVLLFAFMVASFWTWFGWLDDDENGFAGFDVARLSVLLLTLIAAVAATRAFRAPFIALITATVTWLFVTDLISGGGDWSAVVTLLVGSAMLIAGLALDGGEARPYGFWVHVVAGSLVAGALLHWWSDGDFDWALMTVVGLIYMAMSAGLRRGSYAVIGALLLAMATAHYVDQSVPIVNLLGETGERSEAWVAPLGFLFLGLFLALVGLFLARRRREPDTT